MDCPSAQLHQDLDNSIARALALRRPILTHLNADTSWLLQLPYPADASPPPGRSQLNVIFDPWFQGPQSDVAGFFSTQWHTTDSCIQTMAELNQRLQEIESKAQSKANRPTEIGRFDSAEQSSNSYIDAVVISHEFTDHCNKRTLLELATDVPIFATKRAAHLIRSWKHFHLVHEIASSSTEGFDWRKASYHPLPSWLGISQIVSHKDVLNYHSAILLAFNVSQADSLRSYEVSLPAEGIIYTPHGIHAADIEYLPTAVPPIQTLVLLHGLHDIKISMRKLNLGAHNGLKAQRLCQAKYWVSTHDEIKRASGLITPWLCRNPLTLREALDEESKAGHEVGDQSGLVDLQEITFSELLSGESLLLV